MNIIWGFLIVTIIVSLISNDNILELKHLIFSVFGFALFAYIARSVQKRFLDPLADEVYDCKDHLKIIHNDQKATLSLSEIINVGYGGQANRSLNVKLTTSKNILNNQDNKVRFMIDEKLIRQNKGYINDLIQRIDKARRNDS